MRDLGSTLFFVAAGLSILAGSAVAQPGTATQIYSGGSVRDVSGSPAGDAVYVAAYASDEVIEIDPANGSIRRRIKVDDGPSAIAVDSTGIAVLCRAASSVSILTTEDFTVRARVTVAPGTSVLFGAGTGRVGAVNPFDGTVLLIDVATGSVLKQTTLTGGIPVDAAYDGERIAVVGRTNSTAWLLDAGSLEVIATKTLSNAPRSIVSPATGHFVAETESGLMLLSGASLDVSQTLELRAKNLDVYGGGVLCIEDGTVLLFGTTLQAQGSSALPEGADAARWIGSSMLSWSPALGRVWRTETATTVALAELPPAAIEPSPEPVAATSGPQTPPAIEEAPAAVVQSPAIVEEPAIVAAESPPVVQDPAPIIEPVAEPVAASIPPVETKPEPEYRFTVQPTRLFLGGFKPYAPHFGDPTGRTFDEALARALDVGMDEDSLLSAEFPDRVENLKFGPGGTLRSIGAEGRTAAAADGGVEFDLGDVHVSADRITLKSDPRDLLLEGSPKLTRGESILAAERIHAFDAPILKFPGIRPIVPSQQEKPVPHPLVPHGYKEPDPESRPPLGTVEFDAVTWDETERSLTADRLDVNTLTRRANLTNAEGQAGPVYFGADTLQVLGPRAAAGEDFWMTTCDLPDPHYRIRFSRAESQTGDEVIVTHARLQLRNMETPLYVPRYTASTEPGEQGIGTELNIGGSTDLGTYMNVAQWFRASDEVSLAPRVYATTKEGIGVGFDAEYDFMEKPSSSLFRSQGQLRTLYTTEKNGYTEWYHRQELTPDTVVLGQWEQWYEQDVIKDFYNSEYENRTGPRSFLSLAHTRPEYLIAGTVAPSTHDFTQETEKLPELTFHLFERQLAGGFYGTFDAVGGYYDTEPETISAGRGAMLARLSYDWNVARGFNVLPFVELDGTYYTETLDESGDAFRGGATAGVTAQARVQRSFPGLGNFAAFKHIIIPSATISYRPDATLEAAETPQFDALDKRPGRLRVESTLDNILLGKNAINDKVWPVARLTFYQGYDLENEAIKANDYEVDLEVRPRPAWGVRTVAEVHDVSNSSELPGDDFNRVISYVFYDNLLHKNTLNGRVGFAYTESGPGVLNQEVLYGVGYKIAKKWSVAFEHRYDFERAEFTRQTYSIRRRLHDWEIGVTVRDRSDSLDVGIQINLVDFPEIGTKM